ncbi:glycine-rich protein [Actinidia rufa]|uniref:Glycine-rich protein n=1 Tax=Actinidia rufa TaxID=165716 RepID=A0A7J0EPP4_9ERIC|nr:glycine-rich protein [Actinidia rufa]
MPIKSVNLSLPLIHLHKDPFSLLWQWEQDWEERSHVPLENSRPTHCLLTHSLTSPFSDAKDEDATNFEGNEAYDNQSSPVEEPHKVIFVPLHEIPASVLYSFVGQCDELCHSTLQGEFESENTTEIPSQTELDEQQTEGQNQRDVESKDNHYAPRRNFQNQRGGRGGEGGRRGYPNGRVGRGSSRGGGGYQNGRNQYYDQPGNYYPRNYHYNNRGRGGRGGGGGGGSSGDGNFYNNHSSGAEASYAPADS